MGYLNAYILATILVFSAFFYGLTSGYTSNDMITAKKVKQQIQGEITNNVYTMFADIFVNNLKITLIGFIPIIGNGIMLYAFYNAGYVIGLICLLENSLNPYYAALPFLIAEASAAIIILAESIIFLSYLVFKKVKIRIKYILLAVFILLISAFIEAFLIIA